jgi:hypothetical protein
LALPYWAFLFVNNAVSVVMLSLILPRVSRRLGWWLSPAERDVKRDLAGALLVAGFYALWLLAFWLYQTPAGGALCGHALVNSNANSWAIWSPSSTNIRAQ